MTEQPVQAPPAPRRPVPASVEKRSVSRFVVVVGTDGLGEATNKPQAVSLLCREAIARGEVLIVTLHDGMVRTYMTIDETGRVRDAAAPAPDSTLPDVTALGGSRDLGCSPDDAEGTQSWVETAILDPVPVVLKQQPVARGRRWGLRRR